MAVNQFLGDDLARTRPSHGEVLQALEAIDVNAARAFNDGVYSEHFRPSKNFWSRDLRAEGWARGYIKNREALEEAAADTKRFDMSRLTSMFSDHEVGGTLLHAAHRMGVSMLSVAMNTEPVYQGHLEQMQAREAPISGRLATTADEVELLEGYQRAAIRYAELRNLNYSPGMVLSRAESIPHVLVDALTLILYAQGHDEVDGALYRDTVTDWCGAEDYALVLQAVEAGLRMADVRSLSAAGIAPEYAFAMSVGASA